MHHEKKMLTRARMEHNYCKSSSEKGFRLFKIARNRKRGDAWRGLIRGKYLTNPSDICEVHLGNEQFEQKGIIEVDGRKLLRNDTLPTLLPPNDYIQIKDIEETEINCKTNLAETVNNKIERLQILQCSNEVKDTETDCDSDLTEIANKRIENLQNKVENLQKQVKALLQEKRRWNFKAKKEKLCKIFNEDQLKYLELATHNGFCWSDETVNKATQLYLSCGTKGYEELRNQNLPYPSIKTLQKRLQTLKFQPEVVEDIFNHV